MSTTSHLRDGTVLETLGSNKWTITNVIGEGGQSVVYRATSGKLVGALKHFKTDRPGILEKSMQTSALASNKDIAPKIYGVGQYDGYKWFIVFELMDTSIDQFVPQTIDTLIDIMIQTASALSVLHAIDPPIAHMDLKPENILLNIEPVKVKLGDYGLSCDNYVHKCYQSGTSPMYADPMLKDTQSSRGKITKYLSMDIFSLGLSFRQMIYAFSYDSRAGIVDQESLYILRSRNVPFKFTNSSRSKNDIEVLAELDQSLILPMMNTPMSSRFTAREVYERLVDIRNKHGIRSLKRQDQFKVHVGPKGGRYILRKNKKIYLTD
jgi:serine/threonine protein kinase